MSTFNYKLLVRLVTVLTLLTLLLPVVTSTEAPLETTKHNTEYSTVKTTKKDSNNDDKNRAGGIAGTTTTTTTTTTERQIISLEASLSTSNCNRDIRDIEMSIEHPGFPGPYRNNELCRYVIRRASDEICGLEIIFKHFDIESSPGCNDDFLAIGDEKLCGEIPTYSLVEYPFSQNDLVVVFGTNGEKTKSGFQLLIRQVMDCQNDLNAIPAVHACDVLITDAAGEVVTHRSSDNDPVCRYTIGRRHSGFCQVELDFVDFNVDFTPNCVDSYVELEGHRFCGTSLRGQRRNVTFDVAGNVHIVYRTLTVRRDRGFHLLFRQLSCSGEIIRAPGGSDFLGERMPSACNKIFYEKEFYLESPNFPHYYENNLECQFVIRRFRDSICKMDIRFLDFDVESSPACLYDFLEIDGDRLCGRIPEDHVRTTDFLAYEKILRFKTDSVNPRPGFFLYIRQLDCGSVAGPAVVPGRPPTPGAPCDLHLWDREVRLSSPNYPSHYENNANCFYTVHRQGDHICNLRVTFLDFRVQNGGGCYRDYLEIDGWRACGDTHTGTSKTFEFQRPEKVISFRTDPWVTSPGFLLSIQQVPCGQPSGRLTDPCDRDIQSQKFELKSERHPLSYAPGLHCRYVIRRFSDTVCQLQVKFSVFDLESSVACSHDYLALDGERLCGILPANSSRTLRFDSPEKVILFHTDDAIERPGFLAQVTQIDCAEGRPRITTTTNPTATGGRGSTSSCDRHFSEVRATFTSPDYPAFYPNLASCRYVIHLLPGYCRAEFDFTDFRLEESVGVCTRDYLEIGGLRYCGRQLARTTRVESPFGSSKEIIVNFVSNSLVTDKGFLATFRQLPCGGTPSTPGRGPPNTSPPYSPASCSKSYSGHLFDIRGPDLGSAEYGQAIQCVFTVHRLGVDTCRLRVTFIAFDLGDGHDCPQQYMQIGEHSLCGRLPSYTIREYEFRDYVMIMRLVSSHLPRPRVHLQVQQLPCESVNRAGLQPPPPVSRLPPPQCDEDFYLPVFEIQSPFYPHAYSSSVDCRYIVHRSNPDVCHLELTFERFSLATSQHCYYSHVRVDADRLCGSLAPFTVKLYDFTVSPEKIIHFRADHIAAGTGFLIRGRQVPCGGSYPPMDTWSLPPSPGLPVRVQSDISSTRCDQSFGLDHFNIYSPNHPNFYPLNAVCRYVIIRSSHDVCALEVTFMNFDVEDYYQCQRDYLDIDGERLCGIIAPHSIRRYLFHPADRSKLLVFRSDHMNPRPGFSLRVTQLRSCQNQIPPPTGMTSPHSPVGGGPPSPTCPTSYFSTTRGHFRSPGFPRGYSAQHCMFTILQQRDFCSVKLDFRDFDLAPSVNCLWDYVELEGRRYCDAQLAAVTRIVFFPWSESSQLNVVFHSDRGNTFRRGFQLEYEQVPCRQSRWQREETELQVGGNRNISTEGPTSTAARDEAWDDTKPLPVANSTVDYAKK